MSVVSADALTVAEPERAPGWISVAAGRSISGAKIITEATMMTEATDKRGSTNQNVGRSDTRLGIKPRHLTTELQ
jgi:hypothetical protein